MSLDLKELFPHSVEIGNGVACKATPFSGVFAIDYYDGAIEGFLKIRDTRGIMYFKKIWWDDLQNNRLFDGRVVHASELEEHDLALYRFFERQIQSGNWSEPCSET